MKAILNFIENNHIGIGLSALLFGSLYFLLYHIKYPPCCDAVNYYSLATEYNSTAIETIKSPLRTYFYPWLLSHLISLSKLLNLPFAISLYAIHLSLYVYAIFFIKNSLDKFSKKVQIYTFLFLSFNFFVYPYFSLTLTDSLYISLCIIFFGYIFKLQSCNEESSHSIFLRVIFAITIVSIAIVLRPASVWLLFPLGIVLAQLLIDKKLNINNLLISIIAGTFPLIIQVYLNYVNYNLASFLPAQDLGKQQIIWGIENIKYATWLGNGLSQNFYSSGNLIGEVNDPGKSWYLSDPYNGTKLVLTKLISAFDFDFLVPYPYEKPNSWIPSIISFSFLYFGLLGIAFKFFSRDSFYGNRFFPISIFLGWAAVSLSSALELRFTLPILSYMMIISVIFLTHLFSEKRNLLKYIFIGYFLFLPICIVISLFVRAQSTF